MELKQCPYTGWQAYEFKVNCQCSCHVPGYKQVDWMFMPCCGCINNGRGMASGLETIYLYPLEQFPSYFTLQRVEAMNNKNIGTYPELVELMKIEKVYL